MKILYYKNFGERSLIYLIQIMLLQFEQVNASNAWKSNYNNTTGISPLNINYGYVALNSAINEVNIRMLFNKNVKVNQMILYVIVMKTYQFPRRRNLEIAPSNSSIWAIVTHKENVNTQTAIIDASCLSTKPSIIYFNLEETFYLRVKINCSDNLSLVVNGSQNIKESIYQIERPNFTWYTDILRAGGLVLCLLSPTILYITYRLLREWHDQKIRIKKHKEQNRRFILYILPEESIEVSETVT